MSKWFKGMLIFAICFAAGTSHAAGPIRSSMNNKCLDVPGGIFRAGAELIMWPCHGSSNQQFEFTPQGEIRIAGLCVDAYGGGNRGAKIGLWSCHGGPNQKWRKEGDAIKGINNRCIDIAGGNTENGAKLLLWDCHGGPNQGWQLAETTQPTPLPPIPTKGCNPGKQCAAFEHYWFQDAGMGTHYIRVYSTGDYEDQWIFKAQPNSGFFPPTPAPRSGTWTSDGSTISFSGLGTATLSGAQLSLMNGTLYNAYR